MALVSPGLQITVTDESQYIPGAVGTVPLVIVATEQDKLFNGTIASGTTAANAGVLQAFGSQRELVSAMGYPVFKQSAAGTPLHGNELNEYGLMAAYSAAGLGNRIYAIRADIDLAQLESTAVRPVGAVANGIYWLDLANSTFGINEWDATTGIFTLKTPLLLTDTADLVAGPPFTPRASVGTIGSYAVVLVDDTTNGAANFIWYKDSSNAWVRVGSTDWQQSWPTVTGTVVAPTLQAGTNSLEINGVTVAIGGNDLASVVSAINAASFAPNGVVRAQADASNRLQLFIDSTATSNGSTVDGRLSISNTVGGNNVTARLGITDATGEDAYYAPDLEYGTYIQIPSWRSTDATPRPTGSVYLKTTAIGNGASLSMKVYSATADTWTALAAPLYASEEATIFALDPTAGGNGLAVGTVYVKYDVKNDGTGTMKFFVRSRSGQTKITGTTPTSTPTFNSGHQITMRVTTIGSAATTNYTFAVGGTTSAAFVAAILSQNIPNVTAALEASGAISITHRAGGTIYLSNVSSGTALATAGFTTNTSGIRTTVPGGTELVLSNFAELTYTYSTTEPYQAPADGTLWYYGNPLDVDIMICEIDGWKGYRNVPNDARGFNLQNTNPAGPILAADPPELQTDGTSLVPGDLWIDTGDLENWPRIYRRNASSAWIAIDNTDAVSQNGIVFADARWDSDGTTDPVTGDFPSIADLTEVNYTDLDAPSYQLYPRGTLLFNTRRSGYNVKRYVSNLFSTANFPDDSLPSVSATWQTASGNKNDGSPYAGQKAQRRMVVTALRAAITGSTEIREERFAYSLITAPGYPELISDMVALNNDRLNTAFVIGDTPMNLPANIIQLTNWSNGIAGTYGDGITTADPYLGVFYPACQTTDVQGNDIVMPPSHMALRTFIRSDNVSYQWFAPAGTRRGLIDNATQIGYLQTVGTVTQFIQTGINQSLRDAMYPLNINPLTVLPGVGLVCFGQKTRNPVASSLDRINVARLVNYIRTILASVGNGFLFEPNDKITRDQIKQIIEGAMNDLVSKRGVYDYLVVCDSTNNTPERITRNELYVDIAIEPMKDVEFIYIPIRLKNPGDIAALG
jgi:hypothetical protein